jgi:hypothetical protein
MAFLYVRASLTNLQSLIKQACGWAGAQHCAMPWRLEILDGAGGVISRATAEIDRDGALQFETTVPSEETEFHFPVMVVLTDASDHQIQMSVA